MTKACKYIIQLDGDKKNPIVIEDKQFNETRCFSSIKTIPYHEELLVYIKTYEVDGKFESWIGMIDSNGKTIMKEVFLGNDKIEGIEIIPL